MAEQNTGIINGINTDGIRKLVGSIAADPTNQNATFAVTTEWKGQTTLVSRVEPLSLRGETIERQHVMVIDEPYQMGGKDIAMNPQEALFAALNSCVMVTIAIGASMNGITLEKLEMKTKGTLDLRGVFGTDPSLRAGFQTIEMEVRMKGNGTPEQFQAILNRALTRSPNYDSVISGVKLNAKLVLD